MTALFVDENLPDGTCLEPGTKFMKYWKMKNTGNISWTSDTKVFQQFTFKLFATVTSFDFPLQRW